MTRYRYLSSSAYPSRRVLLILTLGSWCGKVSLSVHTATCVNSKIAYQMHSNQEARSHSTSQEIPHLLWKPKVHYRLHNSPIHTFAPCFCKIYSIVIHFPLPRSFQKIHPNTRHRVTFRNKICFTVRSCKPLVQPPKLENRPLSVVHDCLLNIFAAILHIWRLYPPAATRGRAMLWWQEPTEHGHF